MSSGSLQRGLLALLAVVTLALATFFAARAYESWATLRHLPGEPGVNATQIQPWMSVRFIARSQHVPPTELASRLDAPADGRLTLLDLARQQGLSVAQMEDKTRKALADLQGQTPSPGPGAPVHRALR